MTFFLDFAVFAALLGNTKILGKYGTFLFPYKRFSKSKSFSCLMWWDVVGAKCISHVMQNAIRWEFDGREAAILKEK